MQLSLYTCLLTNIINDVLIRATFEVIEVIEVRSRNYVSSMNLLHTYSASLTQSFNSYSMIHTQGKMAKTHKSMQLDIDKDYSFSQVPSF